MHFESFRSNNKSQKKSKNGIKDTFSKKEYINRIISGVFGGHCWGYLIQRKIMEDTRFNESTSCMEDKIFIIE